ncbi:hypothetical protein [Aestuariimicrobium sp. Y1814]|uniref:hypothetical protein n=1 Tax=Aestuariimicrobium sp. Y1814 TaxID=3418742 RepID=UPI003DA6D620
MNETPENTTESREQQNRALAFIVASIRPDWGQPGILAALRKLEHKPLADVAMAAIHATERTDQRTPAFIPSPGEHWRESPKATPTAGPAPVRGPQCVYCHGEEHGNRHQTMSRRDGHPFLTRDAWKAQAKR